MLKIGEIRKAYEFGYVGSSKYIRAACEGCGLERWVQYRQGRAVSKRCRSCCKYGELSHMWKGGKILTAGGYAKIKTYSDSFFFSMANCDGYILEHRLVVAKHFNRCLQSWEIVHHKNHIRNDNRIENLQLVSDDRHQQISILERKIKHLLIKNNQLKEQLGELKHELKVRRFTIRKTSQ